MFLGSTATSTRCEKKEARNLREAHWNTKGKVLALVKAGSSVVKFILLKVIQNKPQNWHICRLLQKECLLIISFLQLIQRAQWHNLIEQILNYKALLFHTVTSVSYAFLSAMNCLCAVLLKICTGGDDSLFHSCYNYITAEMHPLHCTHNPRLISINVQQASMNVSGCHFFCM